MLPLTPPIECCLAAFVSPLAKPDSAPREVADDNPDNPKLVCCLNGELPAVAWGTGDDGADADGGPDPTDATDAIRLKACSRLVSDSATPFHFLIKDFAFNRRSAFSCWPNLVLTCLPIIVFFRRTLVISTACNLSTRSICFEEFCGIWSFNLQDAEILNEAKYLLLNLRVS